MIAEQVDQINGAQRETEPAEHGQWVRMYVEKAQIDQGYCQEGYWD